MKIINSQRRQNRHSKKMRVFSSFRKMSNFIKIDKIRENGQKWSPRVSSGTQFIAPIYFGGGETVGQKVPIFPENPGVPTTPIKIIIFDKKLAFRKKCQIFRPLLQRY